MAVSWKTEGGITLATAKEGVNSPVIVRLDGGRVLKLSDFGEFGGQARYGWPWPILGIMPRGLGSRVVNVGLNNLVAQMNIDGYNNQIVYQPNQ